MSIKKTRRIKPRRVTRTLRRCRPVAFSSKKERLRSRKTKVFKRSLNKLEDLDEDEQDG